MSNPAGTPLRMVLVRHGATKWSESGQHTGRTDIALLPEGAAEAEHLGSRLSEILGSAEPLVVLSSPLSRSLETCRLAGFGSSAALEDDLEEWDYGAYEGLTREEIQAKHPGWDLFRDGCPEGESLTDVVVRVRRVIDRLRLDSQLAEGTAVLFAHGHLLRVLAATWANLGGDAARALPFHTGKVGMLGWYHTDPAITAWNL